MPPSDVTKRHIPFQNAVEDIHNLMLGAGSNTWEYLGNTWGVVQTAQSNPGQDWYAYNDVCSTSVTTGVKH